MLLEERALALEQVQRVQVAQPPEQLALALRRALDGVGERLQHEPVDVGAGRQDEVVLAGDQQLERVRVVVVHAAPQPPREAGEQVLLAPAHRVELGVAVEQVGLVVAAGDQVVAERPISSRSAERSAIVSNSWPAKNAAVPSVSISA